ITGFEVLLAITGADTLCTGESAQLEASPGFASYLWSTGDTTRLILVTQPGTYSVTAQASGCDVTTSKVITGITADSLDCHSISGIINHYAAVTALDAARTVLTTDNPAVTDNFRVGDQILVIQMQGADIVPDNTEEYGSITSINSAGAYEFAVIQNVQPGVL